MDQTQRRLNLHAEFVKILGSDNVYFQPGSTRKMSYPCIIYKRDEAKETRANNLLYLNYPRYAVTVVDPDPDSEIPDAILKAFSHCSYSGHYAADSLNHTKLTLYY